MKKNLVIVSLIVLVISLGYLGIYQKQVSDSLKTELVLTQRALYAVEVGLEGAQYKARFNGNPYEHDKGLFVYEDYLEGVNEYKSRIITFGGLDYPLVVNPFEESCSLADSYEGYELENAHIFEY